MAAFGANAMLLAQFPTAAIRDELKSCIERKALDDIEDPKIAVLIVRDRDQIVSFAKWSLPIADEEAYEKSPWVWPKGTNFEVLNMWTALVESAKQKVMGTRSCYRKYTLPHCTHT